MVDSSQKVHQLGFKCVRIFTNLFEWKLTIPFKLFHSYEADKDSPMVDRSQKVHQLGFNCVRIFTHLFEWKFAIPFKLFHSLEADRRFTNG